METEQDLQARLGIHQGPPPEPGSPVGRELPPDFESVATHEPPSEEPDANTPAPNRKKMALLMIMFF